LSQNNLRFTHYTTREGLSNNIVFSLFQDSRGLLWVGTSNGLNYFDGISFQNIYPTDFDPPHLHSDQIDQITENADGNILLMTKDGMEEYNWKSKLLRLIFPASKNRHIYQFIIDKQKNIWLLSEAHLQKYNSQFKLLENINLDVFTNNVQDNATFSSVDNENNIWFFYNGIICEWDVSKKVLESRYNNIYHKKIFDINCSSIIQDKKGNYWSIINYASITTSRPKSALACYNWKSDSLQIYHSPSNFLYCLTYSVSGKIWVTSYEEGLFIFDTKNKSFQAIHSNSTNINTPAANFSDCIYEDNTGNIWLGSRGFGLDKCSDLSNSFIVMDKFGYEDTQTRYHKAAVCDITACNKNLFVCTTTGFFEVNLEKFSKGKSRYNTKKSLSGDYHRICMNLDDSLLFTSTSRGILFYTLNDKKLHPDPFAVEHPWPLDSVYIIWAFKDDSNRIWLGMSGNNGVYCWNRNNNLFTKYDARQKGKYYFPLPDFCCAAEDDNGNIWMGSENGGLAFFDRISQTFIQPSFSAFAILNDNVIYDMLNDHHGHLWISTAKGLYCYSSNTHQIKQYNRSNGLVSNIVTGLAMDKKGILWMGTYGGLSRFDTATKQFTNFTGANDFSDGIVYIVIYDSATNKICFTTDRAVAVFDPSILKKSDPVLSPIITSFSVVGKQRSLNDSGNINLSYNDKYFSFNYTAPDLNNAADVRYEYKLEGFNKTWVNAGTRHYAGYTNLDGGNYTFKVRASSGGIDWYEISVPVAIHVDTPFYKAIWFYVLVSAIAVAIIFLFIYSAYRAKLKRVLAALKIRNEIAGDLHDDIGSSLSSIMLMSEIAKKQDEPQLYFDRIKENAGKIIESMNDIVWAVNPNNDTIEQLFIRMQTFASSLLEKKDIRFTFSTDDTLTTVKLSMEERKNFYLIFKEAIHNAFKYACCKTVTAQISSLHKNVLMRIHDDGKGFDTTRNYMGNGLNNMGKRAKEINGRLEIISSVDEGTTITLLFTPTHKGS